MSMSSKKILITGASGFVGGRVFERLQLIDVEPVLFGRRRPQNCKFYVEGELSSSTDYYEAVAGCDVIIHIAGRAHVMAEDKEQSLELYREINVAATLALARQAAAAGAKRFIFISSIKVNGEQTQNGRAFLFNDAPDPKDHYGISKSEAEIGLRSIAEETGMEVVIIRPPLVYGPGVKANFSAMLRLTSKNLPLPFGAIHNKRSLVALDNLVDLILVCIEHPAAANQTFLVSDDCDVSTTDLLSMMVRARGKVPRFIPVPVSWFKFFGKLTGKQNIVNRLCGDLQVDINHTKQVLGWIPQVSVEDGIRRCI